jgi:hypothetical protein
MNEQKIGGGLRHGDRLLKANRRNKLQRDAQPLQHHQGPQCITSFWTISKKFIEWSNFYITLLYEFFGYDKSAC